ncbi:phage minor head protein [Moraxella bovis]|uniref:Phage head morphogenesis protein, SPP1 gp7 family n=1 Tax=Moraxella bovis TaxID=476 RepID=A0A378Q2R4_MORBO|nr:phage head morphogenesis protein [Moraxella bovis]STY93427.1 phage head morphogenesis protein, SPP1 gp7 family [Moraxella bovis]
MNHFDVMFKEALAFAKSRKVVPSDKYYNQMTQLQRQTSISIKSLAQLEQIRHIIDSVNKAIEHGETFADFRKRVQAGDIHLPRHRLNNIYRTNIQTAYNRGKWYEQQQNKKDRPYLMYSAINDSRTRPEHRARHGVIRPIDDPFWLDNTPPCGFRCRCTTRALTEQQAKERGITPVDELPPKTDDFGISPARYGEQFNNLVYDAIARLALENPKADLVGVAGQIEQVAMMIYPITTLDELLGQIDEETD